MAGQGDTDIKLNEEWQLTQASTGDAPICSNQECLLQDIRLEAITQPGELFYELKWGWGLLEFLQAEDDPLTRLEISERVKEKLQRRKEIKPGMIDVTLQFGTDVLKVLVQFQFADSGETQSIAVELDRIKVEVNLID